MSRKQPAKCKTHVSSRRVDTHVEVCRGARRERAGEAYEEEDDDVDEEPDDEFPDVEFEDELELELVVASLDGADDESPFESLVDSDFELSLLPLDEPDEPFFDDRLSVLKNPEPLKVTPTG